MTFYHIYSSAFNMHSTEGENNECYTCTSAHTISYTHIQQKSPRKQKLKSSENEWNTNSGVYSMFHKLNYYICKTSLDT